MEPLTEDGRPETGREWVSATEASVLLGLGRERVMRLATRRGMIKRKAHPSAEPFYLRREVESWVDLLSLRRQWLARHKQPRCAKRWTEKIDAETARRLFITSDEAALLGVTRQRVINMVRFGRLACYQTEPGRKGARLWFSRRAVMQIVDDPEHQKQRKGYEARADYDRANRQGRIQTARMAHEGVPKGWLTTREAALRMGVSPITVLGIRSCGHLQGEQIWRNNRPLRYWYFPDYEIERYLSWRRQAKEAAGQPPLPVPVSREPAPSAPFQSPTRSPFPDSFAALTGKGEAMPSSPSAHPSRGGGDRKASLVASPESPFRLDAEGPEPKWACDDVDLTRAFFLLDRPGD